MNKKLIRVCMWLCVLCVAMASCGGGFAPIEPSAATVQKQYSYTQICGISVANEIIVDYHPAEQENQIVVTGPENVMEVLQIKEELGGLLYIEIPGRYKFQYTSDSQRLHIQVSAAELRYLKAMSNAVVNVLDTLRTVHEMKVEAFSDSRITFKSIQASEVELTAYTGADITAHLQSNQCTIRSHTGSSVSVSGITSQLSLTASSASVDVSLLDYEKLEQTSMQGSKVILKKATGK